MQATSNQGIGASVRGAVTSMDERGKRVWHGRESSDAKRRSGYLAEAIVTAVLLYFVSSPLVWRLPFLTDEFVAPLAVIQLSMLASVIASLAFVIYDGGWFRHSVRLGLSALAFAATYMLLNVFPFAFDNAGIDAMVRLSLMIALVGIAIGAVVELLQLLFGWIRS